MTPPQPANGPCSRGDTNPTADWDQLRALQAVLQHGSLSAAARALGSTQPTLGRHIAALEARWGLALFSRSKAGLQPTEAALALAPLAHGMAAQSLALARAVEAWRHPQVQATVRLSASELMAQEVLPPMLADIQREQPGIRIELVPDNRLHDVLGREVDLAVRMAAPIQPQLIAQRVGEVEVGLFAHADYLAHAGTPRHPEDLLRHRLIGHDRKPPRPALPPAQARIWQREHFALRCDHEPTQWALVRAGAGIGAAQCQLAARQPPLRRVLPEMALRLPVWLCMHEDLRQSPGHAAVLRALGRSLQAALDSEAVQGRYKPAIDADSRAPATAPAPPTP